ncbi:oligosaccharide flippase family protein [Vibrio breoganii]
MDTESNKSKKNIVKSSFITGLSSIVSLMIGLIKGKSIALILGPSGIGTLGLLSTLLGVITALFGFGLGTSGVRELSSLSPKHKVYGKLNFSLFMLCLTLGIFATILSLIFQDQIVQLFDNAAKNTSLTLMVGLGVTFNLLSLAMNSSFQSRRQIVVMAKIRILSAVFSATVGILAIYYLNDQGIIYLIISLPIFTFLTSLTFEKKANYWAKTSAKEILKNWKTLVTLGYPFMFAGLLTMGCQFYVRGVIVDSIDLEHAGYFQAAWQISMTYITFVLGAMSADYFPRLSNSIANNKPILDIINDQIEAALILAAPVIITLISFAPMIIELMYSSEFTISISILRWQLVGDVLKIVSWPVAFVFIAAGYSKTHFLLELLWNALYISIILLFLSQIGIAVTGYAFVISYALYNTVVIFLCKNKFKFSLSRGNKKRLCNLLLCSLFVTIIAHYNELIAALLGLIICIAFGRLTLQYLVKVGFDNKYIYILSRLLLLDKN